MDSHTYFQNKLTPNSLNNPNMSIGTHKQLGADTYI